jgi:hypothetical protein
LGALFFGADLLGVDLFGAARFGALRVGAGRLGALRVGGGFGLLRVGAGRLGALRVGGGFGLLRVGAGRLGALRVGGGFGLLRVGAGRFGALRVGGGFGLLRVGAGRLGVLRVGVGRFGVAVLLTGGVRLTGGDDFVSVFFVVVAGRGTLVRVVLRTGAFVVLVRSKTPVLVLRVVVDEGFIVALVLTVVRLPSIFSLFNLLSKGIVDVLGAAPVLVSNVLLFGAGRLRAIFLSLSSNVGKSGGEFVTTGF